MERARQFSAGNKFLQIKVNSSSLGEAKQCWRKYYYKIIRRLVRKGSNAAIDFGTLAHKALNVFYKRQADGVGYERNLVETLREILPVAMHQLPSDVPQNPQSLCRFVVWFLDKYERSGMGAKTLVLQGHPATELSFEFPSGFAAQSTGEDITLFGTIDRLCTMQGKVYPRDLKTTKRALGSHFADSFSPDNQFSLYMLAVRMFFNLPSDEMLLDGAQIGQNFVRFQTDLVPRPSGVLDEWLGSLPFWLNQLEACASSAQWHEQNGSQPELAYPQNDKACSMYGGCQFRKVCSRSPSQREHLLGLEFEERKEGQ